MRIVIGYKKKVHLRICETKTSKRQHISNYSGIHFTSVRSKNCFSLFSAKNDCIKSWNTCNVKQGTLQKFLKISIKNSKCAVSNKHIQDGRPGRYENRRGSKIKAKEHQRPHPDPGTWKSEMSSPKRRDNQELCHLTAKRQGFGRKVPNETIVPQRWGMMPEAKLTTDPKL